MNYKFSYEPVNDVLEKIVESNFIKKNNITSSYLKNYR